MGDTFSVSRIGSLWAVNAGPTSLGVVIHLTPAEDDARALRDALNGAFAAHAAERLKSQEQPAP